MAVNSLYQAILNKIRKIPRIMAPIRSLLPHRFNLPFAPGRIYKCTYKNYHHDPRPLIFILSSDAFHTHAININVLGAFGGMFMKMIVNMRRSNQPFTGMIMYKYLKMRAPGIPKIGYRVYFTKYLAGRLVSDGVSQIPMPDRDLFVTEPFIRALNQMIKPRVINKTTMTQKEIDSIKADMNSAVISADQTIISKIIR